MLLIYRTRIVWWQFGHRIINEKPICIVATTEEVNASQGSAEWFFRYVAACWNATEAPSPFNFVVLAPIAPRPINLALLKHVRFKR